MHNHRLHPGNPRGDPEKLRALAAWYRESAARARNPLIWAGLLSVADELERQAARIARSSGVRLASQAAHPPIPAGTALANGTFSFVVEHTTKAQVGI